MRIEIDVHGEQQVARDIIRFGEHVADPQPLWANLREMFQRIEEERFAAQGPGWAPLKEATVAVKQAKGQPAAILRATDALMRSLTGTGTGALFEATGDTLRLGTTDPKAGFHQQGTSRMPQRKVIDFTAGHRRDLVKRIQRFIVTGQLYPAA